MPTIVLKNKAALTPPASLKPGEVALGLAPGVVRMWAGDSAGNPVEFGSDAGGFVRKTGDTLTGPLVLPAKPTLALQAATKSYVDDLLPSYYTRTLSDARYLQLTGGTLTGALVLTAVNPTDANHATRKAYVDTQVATRLTEAQADGRYLPLVGGTLTGPLLLPSGNPSNDNHATRKGYVDAQVGGRLTQTQGDARYAALVHTHVEANITDLDRLRLRGAWSAGTYQKNDVVLHRGGVFVAVQSTTTTPPSAHWVSLTGDAANAAVSDAPPPSPMPGALWFRTSDPVGMYVRFDDGNSSQWVSVDQAAHGDIRRGAGSPQGVVSAPVGTLYTRTDGGAGSTLYIKESGTGATGWVAK